MAMPALPADTTTSGLYLMIESAAAAAANTGPIPETVFIVYLAVELLTQCVRIWIVLDKVSMKFSLYCKEVVLPIVFMLPFLMIVMYFIDMYEIMSFVVLVCKSILVVVLLAAILYAIGLKKDERRFINNQMKKLFHHYKK